MRTPTKRSSLAALRSRDNTLQVVGLSLYLLSLCQCQDIVTEYFNNPRLYECLCDIHVTNCGLTYHLQDGLNIRFGFPYYYTLTDLTQTRARAEQPVEELFTSTVMCDVLTHEITRRLNCRRLPVDDDPCENKKQGCLVYSIQQDSSRCSFDCAQLLWLADFTLDIKYHNFGSKALPVKEGFCPNKRMTSTTLSMLETTYYKADSLSSAFTIESSPNDSDLTTIRIQEMRGLDENITGSVKENTRNAGFDILLLYVGTAVACSITVLMLVIVSCIVIKRRDNEKLSVNNPLQRTFSNESYTDPTTAETDETSGDGKEEVGYSLLDEMIMVSEQNAAFLQRGDQGFSFKQNGGMQHVHRDSSRNERLSCRPLPILPKSEDEQTYLRVLPEDILSSGISNFTHLINTTITNNGSTSRLSKPIVSNPSERHVILNSNGLTQTASGSEFSNIYDHPLPQPHRRLEHVQDHKPLGLVNLTPEQALSSHVTEVKLVKTSDGHLELVSGLDESPVFTDYYTRILLIDRNQDGLGVVGLREGTDGIENKTFIPSPVSEIQNRLEEKSYKERQFELEIIYIGSLDLEDDLKIEPCDYLTVLDTE
ncbi:hypothetical protein ElyMa_001673400 [Elysia marginata]|uniref:FZ domain-containing protein n=1 Tax=Elysia marginata TaxID=1093978 RepID=A0AAV4JQ15_9GAST|nr:hypothetical protein ElyMa_001673400 [Elysia marginata]